MAHIPGMEGKRPAKMESTKENKAFYFVMKKAGNKSARRLRRSRYAASGDPQVPSPASFFTLCFC